MPNDMMHPPARLLAQMNSLASKKGLPDWAGEVMAAAGLTMTAAETLAPSLKKIAELGKMAELNAAEIKQIAEQLLADQGEAEPTKKDGEVMADAAVAAMLTLRKQKDIELSGGAHHAHPPADFYRADRQSVSLSARLGDAMAAQMAQRLGLSYEPTTGREFVGMSRPDMARMVAREARAAVAGDTDAMRFWMSGAHTSSDYYHATTAGLNAVLGRAIETQPPEILRATHEMSAEDFRSHRLVGLSASGKLRKIAEGADIQSVTVDETGEAAPLLSHYGANYHITREAIINSANSLNLESQVARKMIDGAMGTLRDVILEPLLANSGAGQTLLDGKTTFHADRGNLAATGAAPNVTSLTAARAAMMLQKDTQGALLSIMPAQLVVPPDLLTVAEQLVAELAATTVDGVNPFSKKLDIVCEAGLPSKAWYVTADPKRADGLAVSFLDGNRAPAVEMRDAWERLGLEFRVVWAVAAAFVQPKTWYRNPGQ
ncbi:Mu-like prophage major head subunit gpT [Rhodobacter viridis]|uniref:Mu-like prophage major head subunit gpT n=1 Tax=Rhodobacter viridis TaxID=1054202 RepID=A0A318TTY8_9RHOB|nr:Mu-like prophage major head subunit gpT family protein [Rhodobacter viridis]PYF07823.1 Mu-like prophage major head subunit gpT [Rhodobacter viridis]